MSSAQREAGHSAAKEPENSLGESSEDYVEPPNPPDPTGHFTTCKDCHKKVVSTLLNRHRENDCDHRIVACDYEFVGCLH